jgi:hypothetical protein
MVHVGVTGSKVTLKLKQRKAGAPPPPKFLGHGSCHNLSKSCDTPNCTATSDHAVISKCCMEMFSELAVNPDEIRGMGIVVSRLPSDGSELPSRCPKSDSSILSWLTGQGRQDPPQRVTTSAQAVGVSHEKSYESETQEGFSERAATSPADSVMIVEDHAEGIVAVDGASYDETGSVQSQDFDIELPSLSQIHMSQVQELPSSMRKNIMLRIEEEDGHRRRALSTAQDTRFRQIDVRRIMRLAAIKSGGQSLAPAFGDPVSLTELESLPLEMQLQVANDDNGPVGILSQKNRTTVPAKVRSQPQKRPQKNTVVPLTAKAVAVCPGDDCATYPKYSENASKSGSFFLENIRPLAIFMDENNSADEEAVNSVVQFLELCVEELRFSDAALLLRSIANRSDEWNGDGDAFARIFGVVNKKSAQVLGDGLDKDWIMSSYC